MTSIASKNAKDYLEEIRQPIEEVLDGILRDQLTSVSGYSKEAERYISALREISLVGGKRLRGAFVYHAYKLFGGRNYPEVFKAAAAVELVHAFLLIEDDVMDMGELRRGTPTIHEQYRKMHESNNWKLEAKHFGHSVAINVGIIADHIALNVLNHSDFHHEHKKRAFDSLNKQLIVTGHGQIHDILNGVRDDVTEEDIWNVLHWKTAAYTFENPLHLGAVLAGAEDSDLEILSEYAIAAGLAFQIQDDILGTFGNSSITGKPNDSDIREGKQTLLTYYAKENGNEIQKKLLNDVLGDPSASEGDVDQVRKTIVETGSLDKVKKKVEDLTLDAKAVLLEKSKEKWDKDSTNFLIGIADYMIHREI